MDGRHDADLLVVSFGSLWHKTEAQRPAADSTNRKMWFRMKTMYHLTAFVSLVVAISAQVACCDEPVSFAVIGDYGGGVSVANLVQSLKPDFIITTGDNNYGFAIPESEDWEAQIGQLYGDYIVGREDERYPFQTGDALRFFPTVGNHDVHYDDGDHREGYLDYFHANPGAAGRLPSGSHADHASYYDVRLGDIHLFSLDSQAMVTGVVVVDQLDWLIETAISSDARWKFAFFHHPPYSSAIHGSHEAMQWPYGALGMDAVFSGHDHVYERIERDTNYLVVGTGGAGLYQFVDHEMEGSNFQYNENFGALFASVSAQVATFAFINVNGDVIDRFQIVHDVPEPATGTLLGLGLVIISLRWRVHRDSLS